jgi:hypothetical protein
MLILLLGPYAVWVCVMLTAFGGCWTTRRGGKRGSRCPLDANNESGQEEVVRTVIFTFNS